MILASFIPETFFASQPIALVWVMTGVSIAMLAFGADRVVQSAVHLARMMRIPTVIIGATIVSLGTTLPEACVSVMAAVGGDSGLALGNGVGSIIFDTTVVFGLCCCITRLPMDRFVLSRQGWCQLLSGVVLAGVAVVLAFLNGGLEGASIPRVVGIGFLVLLAGYLLLSLRWARQHPEMLSPEARLGEDGEKTDVGHVLLQLALLVGGLALVIFGSDAMIGSVKTLGTAYGVPDDVMAVTVVAFGTSLPELATGIAAIRRREPGLLVGNVIGADILNVLFVIGAAATAKPLVIPALFFTLHLPVMLMALLLLRGYISFTSDRFRRWQGVPLLLLYAAYMTRLVLLKQY
jgi:cation:H+ antiporter